MKISNSTPDLGQRLKNSVTLKIFAIAILVLLLLIPMAMIKGIISDRENQRERAISEVSNKWAGKQLLKGPILTIPMKYERKGSKGLKTCIKYFHVLPKTYDVKGTITPKKLRRGIYEIVVYESSIKTKGDFEIPNISEFTDIKEILWDNAFVTIGISDLKGIKSQLVLNWGNQQLDVSPGSKISKIVKSGVTINLKNLKESPGKIVPYAFNINLQGSQNVSFIPVGKTTNIEISSPWDSPSFFGNFLPDFREITDKGFTSKWKILQLNRNFSQTWFGNNNDH